MNERSHRLALRWSALAMPAYAALRAGGTAAAILNAANEIAVESFLNNRLSFLGMTSVIEQTMSEVACEAVESLEQIFDVDAHTRTVARQYVERSSH
jgi:1-deoxy-D-xylulose-5-phosphate reductoisomerase